jgi:hypothetical protein
MSGMSSKLAECMSEVFGGCVLDKDNILWKHINGKFIGKRAIQTTKNRSVWLDQVDDEGYEIKAWLCGKDNDYNEIFTK